MEIEDWVNSWEYHLDKCIKELIACENHLIEGDKELANEVRKLRKELEEILIRGG